MRFITVASALVGAAMANDIEARWLVTSSSSSVAPTCTPVTTTCTVTVTAWGGKGSNGTAASPTATGYYVNGADSVTYGAWSIVAGIAAAMLL